MEKLNVHLYNIIGQIINYICNKNFTSFFIMQGNILSITTDCQRDICGIWYYVKRRMPIFSLSIVKKDQEDDEANGKYREQHSND